MGSIIPTSFILDRTVGQAAELLGASKPRAACRLGNLRHGRFGNLRYGGAGPCVRSAGVPSLPCRRLPSRQASVAPAALEQSPARALRNSLVDLRSGRMPALLETENCCSITVGSDPC